MFGTLAAESEDGGYKSIEDAVNHMASIEEKTYLPLPENVKIYNQLFAEYKKLHDYFGRGDNQVMERSRRR